MKKIITQKGTYETYINGKGEIITQIKPTFEIINKKAFKKSGEYKKDKSITLVTPEEVVFKNLKGNKMKLIRSKINGKWIKA